MRITSTAKKILYTTAAAGAGLWLLGMFGVGRTIKARILS